MYSLVHGPQISKEYNKSTCLSVQAFEFKFICVIYNVAQHILENYKHL